MPCHKSFHKWNGVLLSTNYLWDASQSGRSWRVHQSELVVEILKCIIFNQILAIKVSSISWWCHQLETFSELLALSLGIHQSLVNSPHRAQRCGALMFPLICAWINNHEAGDLTRHHAHYEVTVMFQLNLLSPACHWNSLILSQHCSG